VGGTSTRLPDVTELERTMLSTIADFALEPLRPGEPAGARGG